MLPKDTSIHFPSGAPAHFEKFSLNPLKRMTEKVSGVFDSLFNKNPPIIQALPHPYSDDAVKWSWTIKAVEAGFKRQKVPFTMTCPGNVYFECMQSLLTCIAPFKAEHIEYSRFLQSVFHAPARLTDSRYAAMTYFFALQLAGHDKGPAGYWEISFSPLPETIQAALHMVINTQILCEALRTKEIVNFPHLLDNFNHAWLDFEEKLILEKTKNSAVFSPSLSLRLLIENLPSYPYLAYRMSKIDKLSASFEEDQEIKIHWITLYPKKGKYDEKSIYAFLATEKVMELITSFLEYSPGLLIREVKFLKV